MGARTPHPRSVDWAAAPPTGEPEAPAACADGNLTRACRTDPGSNRQTAPVRIGCVVATTPARMLAAPASEGSLQRLAGGRRPAPPERHERTSTLTKKRARGRAARRGRGTGGVAVSLFGSQSILL